MDYILVIFVSFILLCCLCWYRRTSVFPKNNKIKLGATSVLWKRKRELDGVKLTDKEAEREWIQKIKDFKVERELNRK